MIRSMRASALTSRCSGWKTAAFSPAKCMAGLHKALGRRCSKQFVYDRQGGQLPSGSLMDYPLPRADDLPRFAVSFEEVPCRTNPLGVKGIGEAGAAASPPTRR